MSPPVPDHYRLLDLDPTADDAAIKKAYRKIALANHPDKTLGLPYAERGQKTAIFKQASVAYEILTDSTKRSNYNYALSRAKAKRSAPPPRAYEPPRSQGQQSGFKRPGAWAHTQPSRSDTHPPPRPAPPPPQQPPREPRPFFQEPQFQYPKAARTWSANPGTPGAKTNNYSSNNGTDASTRFYAFSENDDLVEYQTITHQQAYCHYSLEELRCADYAQGRRFGFAEPPIFTTPSQQQTHAFTAGTPPYSGTTDRWFYAPVAESAQHTTLTFSNNWGWNFSIAVSKKYIWTAPPILPSLHADATEEITIKIAMRRATFTDARYDPLIKEVNVTLKSTPSFCTTALSSMFLEGHGDGVELRITLATASVPASSVPPPTWRWGFDVDMGFLIPFYKTLRATHLMFYPSYPAHAMGEGREAPATEPFPDGSPAKGLVALWPGMRVTALSRQFYCEEVEWECRKLWRLVAVGSI